MTYVVVLNKAMLICVPNDGNQVKGGIKDKESEGED